MQGRARVGVASTVRAANGDYLQRGPDIVESAHPAPEGRYRMLLNPGYSHFNDIFCLHQMMMWPCPIVFREPELEDGRPVNVDMINEDFMHDFVQAGGDARLIASSLGEWIEL